ncbi:MAG TPA: reverse transcriptase domain-containing protein [Myxococcota bacterium]|nr:reverse transcriptase domain-containing protein [Myxococcota bacterium]
MKRLGNQFKSMISFPHLLDAAIRAAKGTRSISAAEFMGDIENQIFDLQRDLQSWSYHPQAYRTFRVFEPKARIISAAPFRDRVVHHALCATINPVLERYLTDDTYACRVGKGTVAAIRRAQLFCRRFDRFVKLDVRHFFETADHAVMKATLRRLIKDKDLLWLSDLFIDHGAPGSPIGKGLPIGNLTSQNFANLYLGPLDHYVREVLHIPGYVRYMDDMLLFDSDKTHLRAAVKSTSEFLRGLKLEIKHHATRQGLCSDGVPFLGFNIYPSLIRFDRIRRRRFARKVNNVVLRLNSGQLDQDSAGQILCSVFGWAGLGDTAAFTRSIVQKYEVSGI